MNPPTPDSQSEQISLSSAPTQAMEGSSTNPAVVSNTTQQSAMNTATTDQESEQSSLSAIASTRDMEHSATNPAVLNDDLTLETLDIVRAATDQVESGDYAMLRRLLMPKIWWDTAFISHNSASLTDSYFIWYHDVPAIAQPFEVSDGVLAQKKRTSTGNTRNMTMSQLLAGFCQKIKLPIPLHNDLFARVGVLTTALCKGSNNTGSRDQNLPFGIQAFKIVDRDNHRRQIRERTHGQPVHMFDFGGHAYLHKDEGMLERGLVKYSVFGPEHQVDFAFMFFINVADEPWSFVWGKYPQNDFDLLIAMSCHVYHGALLHLRSPANHNEAAVLTREIGRHVFGECTRELVRQVDPDGGATRASGQAEVEVEDEASTIVPPKPKKRKSKKKKKAKPKQKVEDETEVPATEEACDPEDGEEDARPETSIGPPESSSSPSSVVTTFWSPPVVSGPVFSFLSGDLKLTCQLAECKILANASRAASICCPRCTAYSYTRYCGRSHLFSDVRQHFVSGRCGATLIPAAINDDELSIPPSTLPGRAYIQESRGPATNGFTKNTLERHRQALYRSMSLDTRADYFIFDDLDHIKVSEDTTGPATPAATKQSVQDVRGTGKVLVVVALQENDVRKQALNEVMEKCLRLGFAAGELCGNDCMWMYRLFKEELLREGKWDGMMEETLAVQMGFEFGWRLPAHLRTLRA